MTTRLTILVLLAVVVTEAESARIRPKPRGDVAATSSSYRHVTVRRARTTRPAGSRDMILRMMAVRKDRKFPLSTAQQRQLDRVVQQIQQDPRNIEPVKQEWTQFVRSLENHSKPIDLNAVTDHTIRRGLLDAHGDLRFFAARADRLDRERAGVKRLLTELRDLKRKIGEDAGSFEQVSEQMLDAEIAKWEQKLSTIGDDAQLANVDLQGVLQKQAQTMQMMSNIMKLLNDQAMAIIRNIK